MIIVGEQRNLDVGNCCPRRVTIIDLDEQFVYFETRDTIKHKMNKDEFEITSYKV